MAFSLCSFALIINSVCFMTPDVNNRRLNQCILWSLFSQETFSVLMNLIVLS